AIVEEEPEAVLTTEHVGERLAKLGFARDARGLGGQPGEELVHQWAGHSLADCAAMIGLRPADGILDLVERSDAHQRLVDDGRALLRLGLDQLPPTMGPAECQLQRLTTMAIR